MREGGNVCNIPESAVPTHSLTDSPVQLAVLFARQGLYFKRRSEDFRGILCACELGCVVEGGGMDAEEVL